MKKVVVALALLGLCWLPLAGQVQQFGFLSTSGGTLTGALTTVAAGQSVIVNGRSSLGSTANLLLQIEQNSGATGVEINVSAASLGSCGTGTITAGSVADAGGATATGATSCAVNFATSYTNAPFCTAADSTGARALQVTSAVGSVTVAGLTAGDVFFYNCRGRI